MSEPQNRNIISIKSGVRINDLDDYYRDLNNAPSSHLFLPAKLTRHPLGLVPALYQFAITWARHPESGNLYLDFDESRLTDFQLLYENELLFPVICFVWNKKQILNKNGEDSKPPIYLRRALKIANTGIFESMQAVQALKGDKLLLVNFDHLPAERGLLPCFEARHGFLNETFFGQYLTPGLQDVLKYSQSIKREFEAEKNNLLAILYELMKNTHDWARDDINRVKFHPSMRGLLVRFFKRGRERLLDDADNHQGLFDYVNSRILGENNSKKELYMLEISVFDSGSGFVDRFERGVTDENMTDVEIVKKCLTKHSTSEKGLAASERGLGLDRILKILDSKGFLSIRTGRTHLYRDLTKQRYTESKETADMSLNDWHTHTDTTFSAHPAVQGSVITILYPLSVAKNEHE